VALKVGGRQTREPSLFLEIDRFGGIAKLGRLAGFDLDENDRSPVENDKVDLAQPRTSASRDDSIAKPLEEPSRFALAALSEREPPTAEQGLPPHDKGRSKPVHAIAFLG
jgi:hypothetical protein